MPILQRAAVGVALLAVAASALAGAQASPYLPLDDPRLPLLEHLIARGDVADPFPFVRPFRVADATRVLAAADTAGGPSRALIGQLRAAFAELDADNRWLAAARAGGQAYTAARRDVLHPAGRGTAHPYGEIRIEGVIGPIVLVSRPVVEPRLSDDPDWPGRHDLSVVGRMAEAYVGAQFKWGSLFYGQMDRSWSVVGLPGIGVSDNAYSRTEMALEVGTRDVRLHATGSALRDTTDATGQVIHRYFFAHRLGVRLSDRVRVGVWETTVLAGPDRNFDGRYRNPLTLLLLANEYGGGDNGNVLIGLDFHWRAFRHTTLQAQIGIDDIQYQRRSGPNRYPDRWALSLTAFGSLGRTLGWQALYTRATSLAFRTTDPNQNFTDAGVGLGRNFADMDQATVKVSAPWRGRWLLTPEVTLLRQGEGRINDPFPATSAEAGLLPQIFIGTVERTWRLALNVSGREGPFDLQGSAGVHHVTNAGHVSGVSDDRFVGRVQATLGISRRGALR